MGVRAITALLKSVLGFGGFRALSPKTWGLTGSWGVGGLEEIPGFVVEGLGWLQDLGGV